MHRLQRTRNIRGLRAGERRALAVQTVKAGGDLHLHDIKNSSSAIYYHVSVSLGNGHRYRMSYIVVVAMLT